MPPESSSTPAARPSSLTLPRPLLWIAGAVLTWFVVSEGATEAWYRWNESITPATSSWGIAFPDENASAAGLRGFQSRPLTDKEQELLRYDEGATCAWRGEDGSHLTVFHLQWKPDKRMNDTDILHNPTMCLPAVGLKLVSPLPEVAVDIEGIPFRFNSWEFRLESTPVFVFTAVRRVRDFESVGYSRAKNDQRLAKLRKAFDGNRANPVETLQVVVVGPHTVDAAVNTLVHEVGKILPDRPAVGG